ncbi:YxeA family protein [Bacillus proteolyticus]|uniref:YxeA family protein n=1 Tax=Bacillus proteolyticus TaxID=2026192 RepID=UPI002E23FBC7|nr:YxeA family protein [Bacillus proteolyticus]
MKRILTIFAVFILFSSLVIGCERASLNRIGKDMYYVQIKGEGEVEKIEGYTLRNYTLPAYDENGVKKKVTFRSKKASKDHKLNENAFLCLYISQADENKTEISSKEVKSYEEIQKDDLPSKVKEKLNVK